MAFPMAFPMGFATSQEAGEGSELLQGVQLLWLRLPSPQGTAAARTAGGDAARGEALVTWRRGAWHGMGRFGERINGLTKKGTS